jgi:hypothetical protein
LHAFPLLSLALGCLLLLSSHAILPSNGAIMSYFYAISVITFVSLLSVDAVISANVAVEGPFQFSRPRGIHNGAERSHCSNNGRQGSHKPRGLSSLIGAAWSLRTTHPVVGHGLPRPRRDDIVCPSLVNHRHNDEEFVLVLLTGLCRSEEQEEEQEGEWGGEDSEEQRNKRRHRRNGVLHECMPSAGGRRQ